VKPICCRSLVSASKGRLRGSGVNVGALSTRFTLPLESIVRLTIDPLVRCFKSPSLRQMV
jgi:hypothetical protein